MELTLRDWSDIRVALYARESNLKEMLELRNVNSDGKLRLFYERELESTMQLLDKIKDF